MNSSLLSCLQQPLSHLQFLSTCFQRYGLHLDLSLPSSQKVGPDGLSRSLPNWAVLWFYKSRLAVKIDGEKQVQPQQLIKSLTELD